jgi:hypothetical protein
LNNEYEPWIFRAATTHAIACREKGATSVNSLRFEVQNSGLTEDEFAASIGVDLLRLRYWLELETYRAALAMCAQPDPHAPNGSAARPV